MFFDILAIAFLAGIASGAETVMSFIASYLVMQNLSLNDQANAAGIVFIVALVTVIILGVLGGLELGLFTLVLGAAISALWAIAKAIYKAVSFRSTRRQRMFA